MEINPKGDWRGRGQEPITPLAWLRVHLSPKWYLTLTQYGGIYLGISLRTTQNDTFMDTKYWLSVLIPEHSKWNRALQFLSQSETTSIPFIFTWESRPPPLGSETPRGERELPPPLCVSPSRAPVLSCAHYFQALATLVKSLHKRASSYQGGGGDLVGWGDFLGTNAHPFPPNIHPSSPHILGITAIYVAPLRRVGFFYSQVWKRVQAELLVQE